MAQVLSVSSMPCRISANTQPKAACSMSSRSPRVLLFCVLSAVLFSCQREKRDLQPSPTRLAIFGDAARESTLRPGGPISPQPVATNPYNATAYDIAEGQRLYEWYNCSGCHFAGGG